MEKSKVNQYKSFLGAMRIANSYKIVSLRLKFKRDEINKFDAAFFGKKRVWCFF